MNLVVVNASNSSSVFPFNFSATASKQNTVMALPFIYGEYYNLSTLPSFCVGTKEYADSTFKYTAISGWNTIIAEDKSGYIAYAIQYGPNDRRITCDGEDVVYVVFPRILITTREHSDLAWGERSAQNIGTISFNQNCMAAYISTSKRYGRSGSSRLANNSFMSNLTSANSNISDHTKVVRFDTSYGVYAAGIEQDLPGAYLEFISRGVKQSYSISMPATDGAISTMFGYQSASRNTQALRMVGIYSVRHSRNGPMPMIGEITGFKIGNFDNILVGDVVSQVASLTYNDKTGSITVKTGLSADDIKMCKEYASISESYRNGNDFPADAYYSSEQCYMSHFARHNGGHNKDELAKQFSRALEFGVAKRSRNETDNYRDSSRSLERDIQRLEESLAEKTQRLIELQTNHHTSTNLSVRQRLHKSIVDVEKSFSSLKIDGLCSTSPEHYLITMKPCYVSHGGKYYSTARVWIAFEKPQQYSRWAGIASISDVMIPSVKNDRDTLSSITENVRNVDISAYIIKYDMVGCIKRIRAAIINSFEMIVQGDVDAHVNSGVFSEVTQEEYYANI